jgi:hypothetical protein
MATMIIGVDLADAYFQLAIANVHFEIQQRRRLSRQIRILDLTRASHPRMHQSLLG